MAYTGAWKVFEIRLQFPITDRYINVSEDKTTLILYTTSTTSNSVNVVSIGAAEFVQSGGKNLVTPRLYY